MSAFGAFLSNKMEEENCGVCFFLYCFRQFADIILHLEKGRGDRTTLQDVLQRYHDDEVLRDEYQNSNKDTLVDIFKLRKAQEAKESGPMQIQNISVSKKVYAKVGNITANVSSSYLLERFLTFL